MNVGAVMLIGATTAHLGDFFFGIFGKSFQNIIIIIIFKLYKVC